MQSRITLLIQTIKGFSRRKKILLLCGLVFLLFLLILLPILIFSFNRGKELEITAPYVADEIVIKYKEDVLPEQVFKDKLKNLGAVSQKKLYDSENPLLKNYYLLKLKPGSDVVLIKKKLDQINEIKAADPNYIMSTQDIPNDPMYPQLWGLQKIDMQDAWSIGKGSNNIKVGIIDSGIDGNHPELAGKIVSFANCLSGSCKATSAFDDAGHGTHVSGTIGAAGNNAAGVAGINWDVSFVGAKVMDSTGKGKTTTITSGMVYAVDSGARVLNLSLGGKTSCSSIQQDSINYALSKGAVVVVSAGNSNTDASFYSPASCSGVITVGASDSSDARSIWAAGPRASNYGPTVEIAAPGSGILSTIPGGKYSQKNGTSMAAPHVSGVAALLLSVNSGLSVDQVKSCLINNADSISTDKPIGPRLNAFKTLNACSGLPPITAAPTPIITSAPTLPPGVTATLTPISTLAPTLPPGVTATPVPPASLVCGNATYKDGICSESCIQGSVCTQQASGQYKCCYNPASIPKTPVSCSRCSDTYKFCHADWTSTQACVDTENIQTGGRYTVDCGCNKYGTDNGSCPGAGSTAACPSPTPTPVTTYPIINCVFDPNSCPPAFKGMVQICTLKCTAN